MKSNTKQENIKKIMQPLKHAEVFEGNKFTNWGLDCDNCTHIWLYLTPQIAPLTSVGVHMEQVS